MSKSVTLTKDGDIGVITVDNPPVNALSQHVRQGLLECFTEAGKDDAIKAVVLVCAGRTFIAGADISEFGKPFQAPGLHETMEIMENLPKPAVAAIHGTALGGGLETALCCHYRVAVPTAQVGLPEVSLGLLPGAGGTQRLPRLVGVEAAVEAITSGRPMKAKAALAAGVIDQIVEGDLLEGAKAFARKIVAEGAALKKVRDLNEKVSNVDPAVFEMARREIAKARRGFEAPLACVDAIEAACTLPFAEGLKKEQELFFKLITGIQSAAQRHIFFAERAAAKVDDMPKDVKPLEIKKVGIIGAGTMGGGIAMNFVNVGVPVVLLETSKEFLDKGLGVVRGNYERSAKKGKFTAEQVEQLMGMITPTLDYKDLADVDLVIEAVFENMDIKKEVFKKLDEVCKPECILATNTSTLDVNEIADVTKRPDKVIGMHFFSPANVMRLLEIVRGAKTSHETLATTQNVAKNIRKVGVVVGVCDGFVGNRMVHQYGAQAQFLLEEGCLPQDVDGAAYNFGLAMGPIAMGDMAGLDVGWRIRQGKGYPDSLPEGARYCAIPDRICELGRYGQKTGAGYYIYEKGDRTPHPDPRVEQLIVDYSKEKGITRREISEEEIIERLMYALINEGAKILEEGIAQRASDIDIIYVYGYGFPVFRGGPMFYADTVGAKTVYEKVCEFAKADPYSWQPAPLLKKLAEQGGTFNKIG